MKKKILIAFIAVTSVFGAQAQEKKADRSEKMLEYKIKFIEEKLALTEKEKADFIPVYKEYLQKEQECKKEFRSEKGAAKGEKQLLSEKSDAEIEKELDAHIARKEKGLAVDKEYLAKFKKVLPIKKVAQLYEAERAFKKELLDKLRDKKSEGKGKREGERSMSPSSTD
ncbi:hypothetical protein [Acidiluteibacter ferrifornacis]|mgnify:CR=1 FL=1|uniref:Uncharacterized protein n=1 Tax=Acidiluteibacter ferrifornacis TaxID=2692424 RepID=A0A6N9NFQ7_9FLAO|nr:hypothetical protein [Acidiluteibacter ferrifornacis]MBR9833437.1 hypothetical protein [bacterium]NBG65466.1 hypothetical protein [Acidiluteibacter ferrifornacis]